MGAAEIIMLAIKLLPTIASVTSAGVDLIHTLSAALNGDNNAVDKLKELEKQALEIANQNAADAAKT